MLGRVAVSLAITLRGDVSSVSWSFMGSLWPNNPLLFLTDFACHTEGLDIMMGFDPEVSFMEAFVFFTPAGAQSAPF